MHGVNAEPLEAAAVRNGPLAPRGVPPPTPTTALDAIFFPVLVEQTVTFIHNHFSFLLHPSPNIDESRLRLRSREGAEIRIIETFQQ